MAGTAIVLRSEGNLALADGLAVHVGLEDTLDRRIWRVVHRGAVGAAPYEAVAHRHAAAVFALCHHAVQDLALAIQKPRCLRPPVMALLLHPEAAPTRIGGNGIGPGLRCQEQFGGFRLATWNHLGLQAGQGPAQFIGARLLHLCLPERRRRGQRCSGGKELSLVHGLPPKTLDLLPALRCRSGRSTLEMVHRTISSHSANAPHGRNTITAGVPSPKNLPVNFGTPPAPIRKVVTLLAPWLSEYRNFPVGSRVRLRGMVPSVWVLAVRVTPPSAPTAMVAMESWLRLAP